MINSEITFRKLEIFLAFMEKGNIGRAAEQLELSNVSVHRALHTLEEGMNCQLFVQNGRNLQALPAAYTLAKYARDILELTEHCIDVTRQVAGVGQGRMKIGSMYSLTLETLPQIIMGIKLRRPDVQIDLTMGSNQDLLTQLVDRRLDAIIISVTDSQIDTTQFEILPLFNDDIFIAAPITSPLITEGCADLRNFKGQKFISLGEGFATNHSSHDAFKIANFEPDIVARVNDIFSMLNLVQAGVGYSLAPGRMKKIYENTIKMIPLCDEYQIRQTIAVVFAHKRERDPNLLALAAEGRMYARSIEARMVNKIKCSATLINF
ncbi:LysR substrate-binding domain-containing protein [Providencia burhodogranariea]|uniref:LysR family transcriptional regulator n=1 Tax=Providencia burhodogranariea DSM 19968 TaxID=1141662 RepID=K8WUG4_9GAMM|nr:LysR substrate-binding domain-containing protein [Providencia burhodogranariea]EKT63566.1 LysR family transcriptional regulator [Providencia burhodogranariea DSM 19968]